MKRILTAIAILGCMAMMVHAATNEVTSVNVVGYNKVTVPADGGFELMSIQFDAFDPTLLGVFGTNQLTKSFISGFADVLWLYDPATGFSKYYQNTDNQFYDPDGNATNPPVMAGMGMWIQRAPNQPTSEVVVAGEVVDVATQSVDVVEGFQLLAYPYSSEVELNDLDMANDGATASFISGLADVIWLYSDGSFVKYWLQDGVGWVKLGEGAATTDVLPMGDAFWYDARAGFTWTEEIPYADALD
jgi:hypothetical protein